MSWTCCSGCRRPGRSARTATPTSTLLGGWPRSSRPTPPCTRSGSRRSDAGVDELRAIAFGWLARPAELLALLLEHRDPQEELDVAPSRATAFPADLLDALREVDLSPLAPKAVLYVHLHEAAVQGAVGVARVEGLGPVTLTGLQSPLARTLLVVKPVLDLSDRVRTTAYEHPESLKERVHLTTGGDYWPYATSTAGSATSTPR